MKRQEIIMPPACERCGIAHARPKSGLPTCTAHKQRKTTAAPLLPCLGAPRLGLTTCRVHCGSTRKARTDNARRGAEKVQREQIAKTVAVFGWRREVDPAQGLIESYWRSAALVERYEQLIRELLPYDLGFGVITERTKVSREPVTTYSDNGDPTTDLVEVEETTTVRGGRKHILVRYYDDERTRFEKLGIEIVRLGLEARRDEYIRAQVHVFAGILDGLDLTPAQRSKAAQIMRELSAMPAAIGPSGPTVEQMGPKLVRVVDGVIVGGLPS